MSGVKEGVMQAKDIMRRNPVTVSEGMTVRELARVFVERRISGAPVVDREGRLRGVISQTDLVRRDREMRPASELPAFYQPAEKVVDASGYQVEDPDYARVRDIMTPAVLAAEEETPIEEVARMMLRKRIHRIIITRRGRLVGIVTTMDMLRALLARAGRRPAARRA